MARNLRLLDVDRLADECADQTARFFSRAAYDSGYCYELFRRAIVDRNSYAWEKIYRQYQPLVVRWVVHHNRFPDAGEEVDYFVNCALDKMWSALDAEKFKQFQDVASLLRYLQTCVNSVIVDHMRADSINSVSLDLFADLFHEDLPSIEEHLAEEFDRRRLWKTVAGLMRNEREYIVLRYSFMYDLKPSEIYATNSGLFESLDEVYRVKRNVLNRLRRNPALQQFLH